MNVTPGTVAVFLFGVVMVAISVAMIVRPAACGRVIVRFTRWSWMHPFEIVSRVVVGLLFVVYAGDTRFPLLIRVLGYVLIAIGVGLVFVKPSFHRWFGEWCVEKLSRFFPLAGVGSLVFGGFLIYAAV